MQHRSDAVIAAALRRLGRNPDARRLGALGGAKALVEACGSTDPVADAKLLKMWIAPKKKHR